MRFAIALGLAIVAAALPYVLGRHLIGEGSPRALIAVSLGSIVAMAMASVVVLGTIVGPGTVPTRALPALVERCVDAAGQLFRHPVQHWPRIIAALLVLGLVIRLIWSAVRTIRAARRERAMLASLPARPLDDQGLVHVVECDRPLALTVGALRRPRIYISRGLLGRVSPDTIAAVLAHERAHARARHGILQSLGRTVSHSFSFFPPMRLAADHLILGLEFAADEGAVRIVGDPVALASALVDVAAHTKGRPAGALAAGADGLGARVGRLTSSRPPDDASRRRAGSFAAAFAGAVVVSIALALPLSARNLTGSARTDAVHAACHLPHDRQGVATRDRQDDAPPRLSRSRDGLEARKGEPRAQRHRSEQIRPGGAAHPE